ncbi:putative Cu, Zn, superoxide dismutase [Gorgonomyces haynaldii]|nr:putative Cu, Zn, superoxide dismutase [Gorgonomyces haynaldii]
MRLALALPAPLVRRADAYLLGEDLSIVGLASVIQAEDTQALVRLEIAGLSPLSVHGWHIHQLGEIFPDCGAAGGHFNPFNNTHGDRLATTRHVGDLGNFISDEQGTAVIEFTDPLVSLFGPDETTVLGRTVVVHALRDDLGLTDTPNSLVNGNSGARLVCGILQ